MYLIPETDRNARQQNETTMAAANAIKSKRIIELTSGEAGIMNHKDKVYLLDWMQLYKEEQKKRGKEKHRPDKICYRYLERVCRRKIHIKSD